MDILASYTQTALDNTTLRQGGIVLKGQSRAMRQPVHIILLIDNSGSMDSESKLVNVKRSAQMLVNLLTEEDRLSVITFADDSNVLLRHVIPSAQERQAIQYRLQSLQTDGSTNLSAGLLDVRHALEGQTPRKQGVILLTDGHANIGVTDPEGLNSIIQRVEQEFAGATISTVGYGSDHNMDLLTNMAKSGGGSYNVVNNLEDVASVFGDVLGGLVTVSAQKVEIELPPTAVPLTSFATKMNPDGTVCVYVGDLYADGEIVVLFRSAPALGPVRVKGTDMTTLNPVDQIVQVNDAVDNQTTDLRLVMADYRYKTQQILQRVRQAHGDRTALKTEVETLLNDIQQNDRIRADPLTPMLVEDLQAALNHVQQGGNVSHEAETVLAQHSAYLGMARGLRAAPTATAGAPPAAAAGALASFSSPFSNRVQQQYSQALRTTTSQMP